MFNEKKIDNQLRILFPILSGSFIWLIIQFVSDEPIMLRGFVSNIIECLIAYELTRLIYKKTNPQNLALENLRKKLLIQTLWSLVITIPALLLFYTIWKFTFTVVRPRFSDVTPQYYIFQFGFDLLILSLATLVYFLYQFILFWHKASIENAYLEKENIQTQFLAIKNEISPHFLFNNLNTLHGLIFEDQQKAGDYLLNLSEIYRYILKNNSSELVPIHSELEIANAYFALLQNRHGNYITFENKLSDTTLQKAQVAPLVLQMLLENAVKHNIVDHQHQLNIRLHEDNEYLIFENNCHPKIATNSTKLGLKNIVNRYQFLSELSVVIDHLNDRFIVKLPIIKI